MPKLNIKISRSVLQKWSAAASTLLLLASPTLVAANETMSTHSKAYAHENNTAMEKMMHDMHVPSTGNVDHDFITMMIPHHQGAIDMCQSLIRHGSDTQLKALCNEVISTQTKEIVMMRDLLKRIPAPTTSAEMSDHNEGHAHN